MPELPEVEVVRRGLAPVVDGRRIAAVDLRRPDLRFPFPAGFAARLTGATIETVGRRAKYLLLGLSTGETVIVHLGMSGRLTVATCSAGSEGGAGSACGDVLGAYVYDTGALPQHDHVVFTLADGTRVTYNDPRRFGFMLIAPTAELDRHPAIADLGVEPLSAGLTPDYLARRAAGRRADLKSFLLDQRIVAGLGNIYVAEALFRASLSPRRAAGSLARADGGAGARAERLVPEIKTVLQAAIAAGGSSLRDYRHADGTAGQFQETFAVYDREGAACPRPGCGGTVRRFVQAQRSTFHCARCQR
jgi:formamidopyrimidine-DNA glycosylase